MSRRLLCTCFILAAAGALFFPMHPRASHHIKKFEPRPFVTIHAVSTEWSPIPAAEIYFPGPHCAWPAVPAGGHKNFGRTQSLADDPPSWEGLFLEPYTLQDFRRLQYEDLLRNFPMGGEGVRP
ncbi:MAG: hypothetical protein LBF24_02600 [Puniceicoccales bacterium]|jgi:hypothetical protein|nr:hypothetical protein [Puniceicoccales bacterium]